MSTSKASPIEDAKELARRFASLGGQSGKGKSKQRGGKTKAERAAHYAAMQKKAIAARKAKKPKAATNEK